MIAVTAIICGTVLVVAAMAYSLVVRGRDTRLADHSKVLANHATVLAKHEELLDTLKRKGTIKALGG